MNFVSIATEDVPALVADQVDTAILHVEQEMLAKTKVPILHAIARMWDLQPKTLYTVLSATEKTMKDKPAALLAFVEANIEATRIMYTDKAKVHADYGQAHRLSGENRVGELRLPGQELHLGCQQRPRPRAHQLHRRI